MTIIPWPKNVRRKGALTMRPPRDFKGGHWTTALDKAIATFNQLMSDKGIAVTISKAEKEINAHIRFGDRKGKRHPRQRRPQDDENGRQKSISTASQSRCRRRRASIRTTPSRAKWA